MALITLDLLEQIKEKLKTVKDMEESDLLSLLNDVTKEVEKNDKMSVGMKLKIYSVMTMLSNVSNEDRKKHMKKLISLLK
ncbi:MAG: hypothetical protein IJ875_03435 [Solobacterium sp.]|nr:hypothetical protein [Solobacterium sp.]